MPVDCPLCCPTIPTRFPFASCPNCPYKTRHYRSDLALVSNVMGAADGGVTFWAATYMEQKHFHKLNVIITMTFFS